MLIYLDGKEIAVNDLKFATDYSGDKIVELVEVDEQGNLHFELQKYGYYS